MSTISSAKAPQLWGIESPSKIAIASAKEAQGHRSTRNITALATTLALGALGYLAVVFHAIPLSLASLSCLLGAFVIGAVGSPISIATHLAAKQADRNASYCQALANKSTARPS